MAEDSEEQMIDFTIVAMIFVAILTVYVMLSYLIELKKLKYLHESTIAILMGVLTAILCKYALKTTIEFSNEIFFAVILPPIIFSSGYSLRKSYFFQNFGLICFYGILGTIIGFILISLILIFLDRAFFQSLSLSDLLIIASVLCATDTVSAASFIKAEKYPILHSVLFGESIINDAVAIILFRAVSEIGHTKDEEFSLHIILKMSLSFLYLFTFSMLLGIVSGLLLSYLFRRFTFFSQHPIKETSIVLLNGYLTYLLGEIFGLSGIITLFTQSIIIGHYAFMNLSEESKKGTGMAFETVSYIAEAFVFAYLGASILSISENWIAAAMALVLLIFLPFIRAFMVYILPLIYRMIGAEFYLTSQELKVCWFSGMIRGVIAFALCLQVDSENKEFVTSLVLVIVLFTTVGGSSFLNKFIDLVKLNQSLSTEEIQYPNENHINLNEERDANIDSDSTKNHNNVHKKSRISLYFINFEKKYMRPFFGKNEETDENHENILLSESRDKKLITMENAKMQTKSEIENEEKAVNTVPSRKTKSEKGSENFNDWKPFSEIEKNN